MSETSDQWDDLFEDNEAQKRALDLEKPYIAVQKPYSHHVQEGGWTFYNDNPGEGYKVHLNCDPVDAGAVSRFLIRQDVEHKYLKGADVESGKVFTVYTGSKNQTQEIVRRISDGVGDVLKPPPDESTGEIAYAPNIVGRFVGGKARFHTKIPVKGVTILRGTENLDPGVAYQKSDSVLKDIYGDYYGGGINYYDPRVI